MLDKNTYNVAIVSDPLYKRGGAEVQLKYMLETFPNKTLYTVFYDKEYTKEEFPDIKIKASFMQYLPWKFKLKYLYNLLQPIAYKTFNLNKYDVILSSSIYFAKFVNGKPPHINICMTPPKFFWDKENRTLTKEDSLKGLDKTLFKFYSFFIGTFLEDIWKRWDRNAALKVDSMLAISNIVKERIKKFYGIESQILYPPVEVKEISIKSKKFKKENWFLYLGRVETYKGVELAVRAAVEAKVPLKIAGIGDDLDRLKKLVKKLNAKGYVKFLGYYTDEEKAGLLARAKALVSPVRGEDFGIVPVEANAAGTAVIAYKQGGVLETISDTNPKTGILFDEYDYKYLAKILKEFDEKKFKPDSCRKQANSFAVEIFKYKLRRYVEEILESKQSNV